MKTNKKAVLGMLIAIVISISFFHTVSENTHSENTNLQQLTYGAAYMAAGGSEGGPATQAAWGITSAYGYTVTEGLVDAAVLNGWNPAGWVCGAAACVTGL